MAATPKCNHPGLLVIRSYDLTHERAVCLYNECDVPDWKSISHVGRTFHYRYISTEDFLNGVIPKLSGPSVGATVAI